MSDIARHAGTSAMTVSRVLRNDPRHQGAVRERVLQAVRQLGYRKNPLVSELMSRVRKRAGGAPYRPALALLHSTESGKTLHPNLKLFREAVAQRAAELGCGLQALRLVGGSIPPGRLLEVLRARGVRGLIFEHVNASGIVGEASFDFDLAGFASVTISHSIRRPQLHSIGPDSYGNAARAFAELSRLGFRRIGLVESTITNATNRGRRSAAIREAQVALPAARRVPNLILPLDGTDAGRLKEWTRRHRPDAILSSERDAEEWIRVQRKRGQSECEYVNLGWHEAAACRYGIAPNWSEIAKVAVDQLIEQMNRHEVGIPAIPRVTEIPGRWVERA